MDDNQLYDKIANIMAIVLEIDRTEVSPDASMDTIAAWDSLKHMKMIMALEQELGIEFDDEEVVELLSVQLIVLTVKEKLSA